MANKPDNNWEDKLIDLVEEEIELASGKSKQHFSKKCKMNNILELVRKIRQNTVRDVLGGIKSIKEEYPCCRECKKECENQIIKTLKQ